MVYEIAVFQNPILDHLRIMFGFVEGCSDFGKNESQGFCVSCKHSQERHKNSKGSGHASSIF